MDLGEATSAALVLVPALGALLCGLGKGRWSCRWIVSITALATALLSLLLLWSLSAPDVSFIILAGPDIGALEFVVPLLDIALTAYLAFLAYRYRSRLALISAVAILVMSIYLKLSVVGHDYGPIFFIDNLSLIMCLITSLVGAVICIYSIKYKDRDKDQPRFFMFMLLFLGAMNGAVFSTNVIWLFFFWEITTLCSFALIGHEGTEAAKKAAVRALDYTLGGGVAFELAIVVVFEMEGAMTLLAWPGVGTAAAVALPLLAVAILTKSAQMPFQRWLVGAMVAPTPVSALLHSATMVNLGVYILIRISPLMDSDLLRWGLILVGGMSFLVTAVLALRHSNAKRVLAYSTIGNLGLIVACVGIGTTVALTAAIVLLLFHAVAKALLFLAVGVVKHETGSEDVENMAELRSWMPLVAVALYAGMFLMLLPPFGMFAAKWMLAEASVTFPLLAFILAIGLAATVVYYAKWLGRMYQSTSELSRARPKGGLAPGFRWPLLVLMASGFGISMALGPIITELVNPYIGHHPFVQSDLLTISIPGGELPLMALLLMISVAFIAVAWFIRPGSDDLSTSYACGESMDYEMSGSYLFGEDAESRLLNLSDVVGAALILFLLTIPAIWEVWFA